jgi:hypothetical protein
MRPNRWTLWLLAFAVVGFALYAADRFHLLERSFGQVKFTQETCDRIRLGMTRDQVEALLGGPPGNYSPKCLLTEPHWDRRPPLPQGDQWLSEHGRIVVVFDADGRAVFKGHRMVYVADRWD